MKYEVCNNDGHMVTVECIHCGKELLTGYLDRIRMKSDNIDILCSSCSARRDASIKAIGT